jgi:succinate dehydrogenase / fumarate reductase cytochrome b subunit
MAKPNKDHLHFFLLKIHSLTGIIPIGAFLVVHLSINSLRTVGVWQYQLSIDFINNLPFLLGIEIGFIFIPLLFHSLMGFYLAFNSKSNVMRYNYPRNWMYILQRLTGGIIFVFLIFHVGTTVVPKILGDKTQFDAAPFLINIINDQFSSWQGIAIYLVGILAATFHFANGLWGFCVSWGILVGENSQRNASIVFVLFGLLLTFMGFATVAEFVLHPIPVEATIGGSS